MAVNPEQAAPGASDEKLTVPVPARHSVTAPPAPTWSKVALTMPVPSPIVPLTEAGAVALAFCANPLTYTTLASRDGSSIATRVHVDHEPVDRAVVR